ncbi:MAG: peptide synthase, partial [Desulfobulbaceae bacterium]|nr:peptide synthase [Desulfobulbaceae bacterium]
MNYNIAQVLPDTAKTCPDRTGLICKKGRGYRSWTFEEMNNIADWYAYRLSEKGVRRGDRVMLMVRPSL